jgi:DNA repair photolyase
MLAIKEVECKTALNLSKIPGMTYCLNPYIGCQHGCIYCYATFIGRFRNHPEDWGSFIDVKINFANILSKEVKKKQIGLVAIGTVQDAYQPIEAKYRLTRQAIEILNGSNFPFEILTKSDLVCRDIDLFKNHPNVAVELTITTIDEKVRKIFEPNAPSVHARLLALERLLANGIETCVFFGPVIPYFSDSDNHLRRYFSVMEKIGVKKVLVDKLNYFASKMEKIIKAIGIDYPKAIPYYRKVNSDLLGYTTWLKRRIKEITADFKLFVEVLF